MTAHLDVFERRRPVLTAVVIAAGVLALLLRVAVVGAPNATAVFATILLAIAAVSLATPIAADTSRRLPRWIVLAFGLAVVAGVSVAIGSGIPLPHRTLALALGVGAAVSEELFFRRLVYGVLGRWDPLVAIVGSSVLFALVHVPLYGAPVFVVDLGAGLLFSWQRWASGGWQAPAATHAAANVLAVLR